MKILIVSDTHRSNENLLQVLKQVSPIDMLIHCGDSEGFEDNMYEAAGCPVEIVAGNNDFFCELPKERDFLLGDYRVWVTHGHNYMVSLGSSAIKNEAEARGADIVFYGHTHRPVIEMDGDVIAVNPGSLTYPRQERRRPSYCIMEIDEERKAHFTLCYL